MLGANDPTTPHASSASNNIQSGGMLTLTNSTTSYIDFGAGNTGAVFSFTGLTGTGTLDILNWNGNFTDGTNGGDGRDQLVFVSNGTPVSVSSQLGQFVFVNPTGAAPGNYAAGQLADGEVAAAPEPSQVGMMGLIAFGLGGLLLRAKRRRASGV